jgi:large subunit ribosomal protein L17
MFRNMVTSLFEHGRIHTTDVKAKELRRWADHMITLAKRGDLHSRRQALAVMRNKTVVHKLFEEATDRFGDRAGGYTNVFRIGRRRGDAAPISLVELVAAKEKKERKKKKSRAAKKEVDKDKKVASAKAKEREKSKETNASNKAAKQTAPEIGKVTASDIEDNKGSNEAEAGSEGPESTETKEDKEQK